MRETNIETLAAANIEKEIDYEFADKSRVIQALTHTSYANEHKLAGGHNERLEFLGDAVLEVVMSENLYKKYPEKAEGQLSKLRASMVCEPTLAICARKIHLDENILLGNGELLLGGNKRDSIVSDAFEALIGAIYLDGGFEMARTFINRFVWSEVGDITLFDDCKTRLQEIIQERKEKPVYELIKSEGPDHDKQFYVSVSATGKVLGRGVGRSKKAAQQAAAREALKILGEVTD